MDRGGYEVGSGEDFNAGGAGGKAGCWVGGEKAEPDAFGTSGVGGWVGEV